MNGTKRCNPEVASLVKSARKTYRKWTDEEERFLREHRRDGAEMIAEVLGRPVPSVKAKAHVLRVSLSYVPHGARSVCTRCGRHFVNPDTAAGGHGLCQTCWDTDKVTAQRERTAEALARKEYDAERQKTRRARSGATVGGES